MVEVTGNLANGHDVKKRQIRQHRAKLACKTCRVEKLKCNRRKPCGSCVVRREEASCQYDGKSSGDALRGRTSAYDKLDHLEARIQNLIHSQARNTDAASQPAEPVPGSEENLIPSSSSAEQTPWTPVLDDIRELKSLLDPNGSESDHSGRRWTARNGPKHTLWRLRSHEPR